MEIFIARVLPLLLGLQGLIVAAGTFSSLRSPGRAAALYSEQASDPVFMVMMSPLQGVVAIAMFLVAYALATKDAAARRYAGLGLLLFAVMEIGFVAARFRVNQLRGASPWWQLPAQGPIISWTACAISGFFAVVYLAGWLAIRAQR